MKPPRKDIIHEDGPFAGLSAGDLVQVLYDGAQAALIQITQVNRHSLEGIEGGFKCKVTLVSLWDLRFYAELGPNRQTVLRPISLRKVKV